MNAKAELKELAKAIDIITSLQESPEAKDSELVLGVLADAELVWHRRYRELQKATARKKPGGAT